MTETWFVYILNCRDNTLYTGVTNNIEKRILAHNTLETGAKYTKVRRPVTLLYKEVVGGRSEAQKREAAIRKLSRSAKLRLISLDK
jgi:putative endonuclease